MYRFFSAAIRPLLEAAKPSVVVEIGSDNGYGTELLAPWCRDNGAVLHAVDPLPKYDVEEWAARWPGAIEFHLDLSLNALVDIGAADFVCIDGDHNWYTVFHEMELLGRSAAQAGQPYPLTLFHDVGWPYGRRDLYYDPSTIPEGARQPYRRGGLVPGRRSLSEEGFNDHLDNALHEGTPRNGVLTAIEDYVAQHEGLTLHVVPGLHGLGIVVDSAADAAVLEAVEELLGEAGLRRVLEAVERDRLDRLQLIAAQRAELDRARAAHAEELRVAASRLEEARGALRLREEKLEAVKAVAAKAKERSAQRIAVLDQRLDKRAEQLDRTRKELRQARRLLAASEENAAELRRRTEELADSAREAQLDYDRLRTRRSVRLALWLAGLTRPLYRLRRRRSSGSSPD